MPEGIRRQVGSDALYARYIARQDADISALKRDELLVIPDDIDVSVLPGLSKELRLKLTQARPANLAQAARIEGMTPAALTLLLAHLRKHRTIRAAG